MVTAQACTFCLVTPVVSTQGHEAFRCRVDGFDVHLSVSAFAWATGDSKVNGHCTCNGHQAVGLLRLRSDMKMEPGNRRKLPLGSIDNVFAV